jgi:hypothetical protein
VREKRCHLDCHLVPFFGRSRLDEIKIERLERFIATLRRILVSAVGWEVLPARWWHLASTISTDY